LSERDLDCNVGKFDQVLDGFWTGFGQPLICPKLVKNKNLVQNLENQNLILILSERFREVLSEKNLERERS
jgi:hypothetical protein